MAKGKRESGDRKTELVPKHKKSSKKPTPNSQPWSARNMAKKDLGGVIFACKVSTFRECISKQLFGLPSAHFAYVKNVTVGMPLFLFNVTDRKLYGIFEAASPGQLNIDKHAWMSENSRGSQVTPFPAQAHMKLKMMCKPLAEKQFKPILAANYLPHDPHYFWFELDQDQTHNLLSLLKASPVRQQKPPTLAKWGTLLEKSVEAIRQESCSSKANHTQMPPGSSSEARIKGKEVVEDQGNDTGLTPGKTWSSLFKAQNPSSEEQTEDSDSESLSIMWEDETSIFSEPSSVNEASPGTPLITCVAEPPTVWSESTSSSEDSDAEMTPGMNSEICAIFDKLLQTVGEIKEIQLNQTRKIESLDLGLAGVNSRLYKLECHQEKSGITSGSFPEDCCDSIILVGGFDGSSWLQDLVSYFPSEDLIQPLVPMTSVRPYASAVELNGKLFVLGGGGHGGSWYDTVESYNMRQRQWVSCPDLSRKKGSLAGASLLGKIFVIGGGNETGCLSEVEVLDVNVGKWMLTTPMLFKRFSSAAAELNGVLYVAGGYDGHEYLRSVERYDPRVCSWMKLESLDTRRGCHSLAVLNEKLYAIGGYDGEKMVPTVEVFDPRVGSWTLSEPMTCARGYMGAATLGDSIYALGGMPGDGGVLDTVESYSDGKGWQLVDSKSIGARCFFSAVACNF